MATRIAVLGLGTMGLGMARNLRKAGFEVAAYNRTRSKTDALARGTGAQACATPAEAARGATLIVAMLADDDASRAAWTGANGALATASQDAIAVESSTLSRAWVEELAGLAEARGLPFLDAPVTGSRMQAEAGELNFLVGGKAETLARARPLLEAMGRSITHLGPVGSGGRLKLINNFLCGVQVASLAEGLTWLERSGLDREQALNLLRNGAPSSPLLKTISQRMVEGAYDVNFLLRLMDKDLRYAELDAAQLGVELRTAGAARSRFADGVNAGVGDRDMSAVIEPVRGRCQS